MRPALSACFVLALALAGAAPARAEPANAAPAPPGPRHAFRFTYVRSLAADPCPANDTDLRRKLISLIRYDPFQPAARDHLLVTIDRRGRSLIGTAIRLDFEGREVWRDEISTISACRYLIEALAYTVHAALPDLPTGETAEPPPPAPTAPAPTAPEPPRPPPVAPPAPVTPPTPFVPAPPVPASSKPCPYVLGGVDAVFAPLITPSASAGLSPWFSVEPCNVPLSFEAGMRTTWSLAGADVFSKISKFSVRSSLVSGFVSACWRGRSFFACPIVEMGAVRARTSDPSLLGVSPFMVAVGARGGVSWALSERVSLRGLLDVQAVAIEPSLRFRMLDVHRAPPVSIVLAAGVSIRLPSSTP